MKVQILWALSQELSSCLNYKNESEGWTTELKELSSFHASTANKPDTTKLLKPFLFDETRNQIKRNPGKFIIV